SKPSRAKSGGPFWQTVNRNLRLASAARIRESLHKHSAADGIDDGKCVRRPAKRPAAPNESGMQLYGTHQLRLFCFPRASFSGLAEASLNGLRVKSRRRVRRLVALPFCVDAVFRSTVRLAAVKPSGAIWGGRLSMIPGRRSYPSRPMPRGLRWFPMGACCPGNLPFHPDPRKCNERRATGRFAASWARRASGRYADYWERCSRIIPSTDDQGIRE